MVLVAMMVMMQLHAVFHDRDAGDDGHERDVIILSITADVRRSLIDPHQFEAEDLVCS